MGGASGGMSGGGSGGGGSSTGSSTAMPSGGGGGGGGGGSSVSFLQGAIADLVRRCHYEQYMYGLKHLIGEDALKATLL